VQLTYWCDIYEHFYITMETEGNEKLESSIHFWRNEYFTHLMD
jgi:hypothetical protein